MITNKTLVSKLAFAFSATLLMLVLCSISSFSRNVVGEMIFAQAPDTIVVPVAIPDTAAGVGAVYTEVEVRPDFSYYDMHGVEAFRSYAQNRLNYPEFESESDIRGKIYVSFIVEVDGRISTIKVVRSFNDFFDIYAIRAVAGSPRWIPGKQGGVPVRVKYTIPLTVEIR